MVIGSFACVCPPSINNLFYSLCAFPQQAHQLPVGALCLSPGRLTFACLLSQKVARQQNSTASASTVPAAVNTGRTDHADAVAAHADTTRTTDPRTNIKDCDGSIEKDTVTRKDGVRSSAGNAQGPLPAQPVDVLADDTLELACRSKVPNEHPASHVRTPLPGPISPDARVCSTITIITTSPYVFLSTIHILKL